MAKGFDFFSTQKDTKAKQEFPGSSGKDSLPSSDSVKPKTEFGGKKSK